MHITDIYEHESQINQVVNIHDMIFYGTYMLWLSRTIINYFSRYCIHIDFSSLKSKDRFNHDIRFKKSFLSIYLDTCVIVEIFIKVQIRKECIKH